MAKKTMTVFTCDWCGATAPAVENGYSGASPPDGWTETYTCSDCGVTDALLCAVCGEAKAKALRDVEATQRASHT